MACGRHSAHLELFVPEGCRTRRLMDILELFDFAPDGEMEAAGGLKALVWDFRDGDGIPDNLHGKLQSLTWRWKDAAARLVMCMSDGTAGTPTPQGSAGSSRHAPQAGGASRQGHARHRPSTTPFRSRPHHTSRRMHRSRGSRASCHASFQSFFP